METTEELKARAWAIAAAKPKRVFRSVILHRALRARPPMSAEKFRAVLKLLGWSQARTAAELKVTSVGRWHRGDIRVPRSVELALLFCLLRDQPTKVKENSEFLARIP